MATHHPSTSNPAAPSPFHDGERAVHERLGIQDIEPWARRVVRPFLPEEHRLFHTAQPFLVAAARDEEGRPWSTLLVGDEGFVTSPDDRTLAIDARPAEGDPLSEAWQAGLDVGLLGIDLATRRRNRVNGRLRSDSRGLVHFAVDQSFGNCPQYIQERVVERVADHVPGRTERSADLSAAQQEKIAESDTFFLATGHRGEGEHESFGMDASHRGGPAGFVRVESASQIVFPDYAGNNHFNTIGNLVVDEGIGLLFVDFERGDVLQLTGRAEIVWTGPELARFPRAQRLVRIRIDEVVERSDALPLRWRPAAWHALEVVARVQESDDVVSLLLADPSGRARPDFEAGQHLPLRVRFDPPGGVAERTYSISSSPLQDSFRISVKRDPNGLVSNAIHQQIEVGDRLEVGKPSGDFTIQDDDRPVFLISAGIGMTPLLSMLGTWTRRARDGRAVPAIEWIHTARDGTHHPLREEVDVASAWIDRFRSFVAYTRPRPEDREVGGFDHEGRLDLDEVAERVKATGARVYLCGPTSFANACAAALDRAGVPAEDFLSESFGGEAAG